jgi:hypothetical protein
MRLPVIRTHRILACAALLGIFTSFAASGTVVTMNFGGTFTCFVKCTPASAATAELEGVTYTGTYSYDTATVPTSGDFTTFADYNGASTITMDVGAGRYTVNSTATGFEILRNHSVLQQDEVYFFGGAPVFGGTGTFTPSAPNLPESFVHYFHFTSPNILSDTQLAHWPQTIAAWSAGFAGAEFFIFDASNNRVGFRGAFTTLAAAIASPTIATTASPNIVLGAGTLLDNATVSGRVSPLAGATIDFSLFGPGDTTCTGTPVFQSLAVPYPVAGGPVASLPFTPTQAGTYRWIASYSGDANNLAVAGACNDANENVVVNKATPTIATTASADITIGAGSLTDSVVVSGRVNPLAGATINFFLYGPNDVACLGLVFASPGVAYPVAGGPVISAAFTPAAAGTYRWRATYSGDANNAQVVGACNDANESTTVIKASPTLATTASASVVVGGSVNDSAGLAGGFNPIGTIAFALFGPGNPTCTGVPAFTSTILVNGNGNYGSGNFTPGLAGTYLWIAGYSSDANNNLAADACGAAGESVIVQKATPTLAGTASPTVVVGNDVSDAAALAGGSNPTGSMTFMLFGPNDPTCSGAPAFTSAAIAVNGNGNYGSGPFTTSLAGTYLWIASYSGDANNNAVATACGAPGQSVVVQKASPAVTTGASPSSGAVIGTTLSDTATLAGGFNPTGTIVFNAFGPNDATCSGTPAFTSALIPVSGNGIYTSGSFTPTSAGTYRWIASYSGDANNNPAADTCALPLETVPVAPLIPTLDPLGLLLLMLGLVALGGLAIRRIR